MAKTYTHSVWIVRPGQEEEFVRRWQDLADWSALQGLSGAATLLRDFDDSRRFVSFAPWESLERVATWRGSRGFHERIARLHEVVDEFDPRTLIVVAES